MADSLFDNRYRYDYIYPRGRSGETLRAVDIQNQDRLVVIKRPAPSDAPPIRAGQEVSILNERRALTRLAGHPALPELLGEGQFVVGGISQQYIVMERAEGVIIADEVLALAAKGEYLPELETLVIVDRLLDLLSAAHKRDIIYNDVDAKHLFWNRDSYRLKVIDWGNAVFLEGDEITPQGISRQSDIYQTGEVLFFIMTGGRRPDIPRDAGDDFRVNFGNDSERITARLQTIISKALHPNPRMRYAFITELRRDLAEYRGILERERDGMISRIAERLRRNLSKNDLRQALMTLETVMISDPGYPAAKQTRREILERLQDLEVEAGLDAVRIYLESANWGRGVEVLNELRDKTSAQTAQSVNLLLDCAKLLLDSPYDERNVPPAIIDALSLMFEGRMTEAAQLLLLSDTPDDGIRQMQWLLAERISSHVPEVLLLRPNLYRLELALSSLAVDGIPLPEPRAAMADIRNLLDGMGGTRHLPILRDNYRTTVDRLSVLNTLLSTVAAQYSLSNRKLPLTSLDRALNAAMMLADNMHVIGKQATTSPRDALSALDNSRAIDPTNPCWDAVGMMLDTLYRLLQSYQTYVPNADGSDLDLWLKSTQFELNPFLESLFDDLLISMVNGLKTAEKAWGTYADATLQGDRGTALNALTEAIDGVNTISPTLAGWLNQLRSVVDGTSYIERHALYGGLGRALADGWEAFDRSRLVDAERLGEQALQIARTESERFASQRLRDVAKLARDWVERGAVLSSKRTHDVLDAAEKLYTPEELRVRDNFNAQMPSKETFLKAMTKGLVEIYNRRSTAAARILALNYILLGTLDAHDDLLDDSNFWREATLRILGEGGSKHILVRTLDEFVERRRDLSRIVNLLNGLNNPEALKILEKTRRLVEENPQAKTVSSAILSVREFEVSIRDWVDGDFRAAGLKLENAIKAVDDVQNSADIQLTPYREWLTILQAAAAELHVVSRGMRQALEKRPPEPDDTIRNAHHKLAQISTQLLGSENAALLIGWRDTYERFLSVYTDRGVRRSQRLERFNELFKAMFIDRHPAYALYRHWYDLTERSPEFPAPPTDDPTPRLDDSAAEPYDEFATVAVMPIRDENAALKPMLDPEGSRRIGSPLVFGVIVLGLVIVAVIVLVLNNQRGVTPVANIAITISETPTANTQSSETATLAITHSATPAVKDTSAAGIGVVNPSPTRQVSDATATPLVAVNPATSTPELPTSTPSNTDTPTITQTPSATLTPSITPTLTVTPSPTLPAEGLQGTQNLLELLPRLAESDQAWTFDQFSLGARGEYWRLGTGVETPGDEIQIVLASELLNRYYGNNAALRIRRVEAEMTLLVANPEMPFEQVYFGLGLRRSDGITGDDGVEQVGITLQQASATAINIYQRTDTAQTFIIQRATNFITGRLRIERSLETGTVTMYLNDAVIGQPMAFVAEDVPVVPVLYVQDGGVVVSVTDWRVNLK